MFAKAVHVEARDPMQRELQYLLHIYILCGPSLLTCQLHRRCYFLYLQKHNNINNFLPDSLKLKSWPSWSTPIAKWNVLDA